MSDPHPEKPKRVQSIQIHIESADLEAIYAAITEDDHYAILRTDLSEDAEQVRRVTDRRVVAAVGEIVAREIARAMGASAYQSKRVTEHVTVKGTGDKRNLN